MAASDWFWRLSDFVQLAYSLVWTEYEILQRNIQLAHASQNILDWTKWNLRKTNFKKNLARCGLFKTQLTASHFLTAVFKKFSLFHSWILEYILSYVYPCLVQMHQQNCKVKSPNLTYFHQMTSFWTVLIWINICYLVISTKLKEIIGWTFIPEI